MFRPGRRGDEGMLRNVIRAAAASAILAGSALGAASALAQSVPSAKSPTPAPRDLAAKVDAYMKAAVAHDQFMGTVLIARDGAPVLTKSYGMANIELSAPDTPQTVFRIASVTKGFTALAIMQLQEQGKLNVADPICRYLDDCPPAWAPITIRQLLTQTSGIPNYSSLPDWDEQLVVRHYERPQLVALFRDLPLEFVPGEKYAYTNSGYYLLGLIIERASGEPYEQYLQDRIFKPLGMTHTRFDERRALIPHRATGYYSRGTAFISATYEDPTTAYAGGGLYSTVGDLLLWDQALYSERLVSRKSLDEIFTPVRNGYGYGWRIGEKHGRREADHSGSLSGFSSYIIRFPAERVAVIVLSNSDRASAGKAGVDLAAIYFGAPYKPPVAQLRDVLWDRIMQDGVASAIQRYQDLKRTDASGYDFGEDTLVALGYDLFEDRKLDEAAEIFKLSLQVFPKSAYSHDGLADVAAAQGDRKAAIDHFETSLGLDPTNTYAVKGLERLRGKASS
jgi:CubicO group peptidase (beta-lactamase class C family)